MTGALALEMWQNRLKAVERTKEVGGKQGLRVISPNLFKRSDQTDTGIVNQNIKSPEVFDGISQEQFDLSALGDIARAGEDALGELALEFGRDKIESLLVPRSKNDIGAFGGESGSDGKTDTSTGTGNDNGLVGKSGCHRCSHRRSYARVWSERQERNFLFCSSPSVSL